MKTKDLNFAYKVRHALNESADNLPPATVEKLAAARQLALSRKKPDAPLRSALRQRSFAGVAGAMFGSPFSWIGRMGLALPLVVLVVGLTGIYQFESQHRIAENAAIDAAVLTDELPLSAYVDEGFSAYLDQRDE